MASKEVMIVAPEELKNLAPSEKAMDAYRFALANAGIEMDGDAQADFVKAMAQLKASHEEKYTQVMGSLGYEAASEVPASERRKVFKAIQAEINKEADNGK